MRPQQIVLVDEQDRPVGQGEKMAVHREGLLHRAFSVFIFDAAGRMLLQQRAKGKYHGGLLWTNACCSHPFPGEEVLQAAERRLREELGFTTPLHKIFDFVYHAEVENGLIEHEYDHVFAGTYSQAIQADGAEVAAYAYRTMDQIREELSRNPSQFTSWFKIAFPKVEAWLACKSAGASGQEHAKGS